MSSKAKSGARSPRHTRIGAWWEGCSPIGTHARENRFIGTCGGFSARRHQNVLGWRDATHGVAEAGAEQRAALPTKRMISN
jgi:hypothetical protein